MKKYFAMLGVVLGFCLTATALPENEKPLPPSDPVDLDLPGACAFPENLVTNCGFETGTFSGWTQFGDTSFTGIGTGSVAYTGNFGVFAGPTSTLGGIYQNVPTTAGQTYALTFALQNNGVIFTPNELRVSWNGTVIYSCVNCPMYNYSIFGFNQLMATGSTSEVRFSFFNVPDYFDLDDVIVVPCNQE